MLTFKRVMGESAACPWGKGGGGGGGRLLGGRALAFIIPYNITAINYTGIIQGFDRTASLFTSLIAWGLSRETCHWKSA